MFDQLREIRHQDHTLYHNNKTNRQLHFFSGMTFIFCYILFFNGYSQLSVYLAWLVAMPLRQIGHFMFEPLNENSERIKTGFNLNKKILLHSFVYIPPLISYCFNVFSLHNVYFFWLSASISAIISRCLVLSKTVGIRHSIAWGLKIILDPFHDVMLYHNDIFGSS